MEEKTRRLSGNGSDPKARRDAKQRELADKARNKSQYYVLERISNHREDGEVLFGFMSLSLSDLYKGSVSALTMMYEWDYDTYQEAQELNSFLVDIKEAQESDHKAQEAEKNPQHNLQK